MKCLINKFISLTLCIVLVSACTQSSFAQDYAGDAPVISVSGIKNGDVVDKDSDISFEIDAADSDGDFEKIICYLDGENYCESAVVPKSVTISNLTPGKRTITLCAEDAEGNRSYEEIILYSTGTVSSLKADADFALYTGGDPAEEDIIVTDNGGYQRQITVDSAHGTSLSLGAAGNTEGLGVSVGIRLGGTAGKVTTEFDFYTPSNSADMKLMARDKDTKNYLEFLTFGKNGKISVAGSGGSIPLNNTVFKTQTWYRIRLIIDGKTNKFECYLGEITYDGSGERVIDYGLCAKNRYAKDYNKVTLINTFRIFVLTSNNEAGNFVIDNLYSKVDEQMPYITGISGIKGADVYEGAVYDADKLVVKLSGAVLNNDITNAVSITDEISDVGIVSAMYDSEYGGIVITPKRRLNSNLLHSVTLAPTVPVTSSLNLGYSLTETFTASAKDYDVSNGKFESEGNSVSFALDVSNNSGDSQSIVVILCAWNGDAIVAIRAAEAVLSDGQTMTVDTGSISKIGSDRVEAYAAYGLYNSRPISNKIWILD